MFLPRLELFSMMYYGTAIPQFIALCFITLHRCCNFYTLKARPSTSKKITIHFIAILALLPWSGTKPTMSLRYACIYSFLFLTFFLVLYLLSPGLLQTFLCVGFQTFQCVELLPILIFH